MANMINVDGSDDPSYRYKMPRLVSKVEGKGNGVKTILVNCADVAQALHRSTGQVNKFFGCELGAMTKYEEKIERCLVNGAFENKALQEALTGYIQKFVLCPSCGNPETVQELKGKKKAAIVLLNCKACGALEPADNTHKLVTFIVKELSPDETATSKRKVKGERKKKDSSDSGENDVAADESVDSEKKAKKKKKKKEDKDGKEKKKKKEKKKTKESSGTSKSITSKSMSQEVFDEGKENDESSSDSDSNDTMELENGVALVANKLGSLTIEDIDALNAAVDMVSSKIAAGGSRDEVLKLLEDLQVKSGLRRAERLSMMIFSIINDKVPAGMIPEKVKWLAKVKSEVKDTFLSTDDLEIELLLALEESVARIEEGPKRDSVRKCIPIVLKAMYDQDLIDERSILQWNAGGLNSLKYKHLRFIVAPEELAAIKLQAQPIVEWLEDAESDSEASED